MTCYTTSVLATEEEDCIGDFPTLVWSWHSISVHILLARIIDYLPCWSLGLKSVITRVGLPILHIYMKFKFNWAFCALPGNIPKEERNLSEH